MTAILRQIVAYGSKDITILEAIMRFDPTRNSHCCFLGRAIKPRQDCSGALWRSAPVSGAMILNSVEVFMVQFIRSLFLGALVLALGLAPVGCGKDVKPTTEKPSGQDKMREMQDKGRMQEGMRRGDKGAAGADKDKNKGNGKENEKDKEDKDKNDEDKE
jgi:hypothetical protein